MRRREALRLVKVLTSDVLDLAYRNHQLEKQRDKLLAACKAVYNSVDETEFSAVIPGPVFAQVMKAIAKVRGQ